MQKYIDTTTNLSSFEIKGKNNNSLSNNINNLNFEIDFRFQNKSNNS